MTKKEIKVTIKLIQDAINGIYGGFNWSDTKQKHRYWADVVNNLIKIREKEQDKLDEMNEK